MIIIVKDPPSDTGRLWISRAGIRYAFFQSAIDLPSGVALINTATTSELEGSSIHRFETIQEAATFLRDDVARSAKALSH